jgi:hypothetical protein
MRHKRTRKLRYTKYQSFVSRKSNKKTAKKLAFLNGLILSVVMDLSKDLILELIHCIASLIF